MDILSRELHALPVGSPFEGYFVIEYVEIKKHRTGEPFLRLVLSDRTGAFSALWWKPPKDADLTIFKKGDVVFVSGCVEYFQGNLQPKLKEIRLASPGEFDPKKFLCESRFSVEDQFIRLLEVIESIKNPFLKKLLEEFFYDDEFVEKFLKAPAGKTIHHACIGGLLEHTLGVVEICETVAGRFKSIDRDLLVTAAILHDIGKVYEYEVGVSIERTTEGILLGHLYMGCEMVALKIEKIGDFPKDLKVKLLHCILAHHGEYEHGSPKKPKTLEAVALAYADALDSRVKVYQIEKQL
ncbi:MAG: phosphohydrolase [Desulfurobacterium sp.]|nr:MAG: phosphohydrolase [Desulfurobacterium sp.]